MASIKSTATAVVMGFALGVGLFRGAELSRAQARINPPKIHAGAEADVWDTSIRGRIGITDNAIVFMSNEGLAVGELSWARGKLYFTGSAHGTADNFFHSILKPLVDNYISENCKRR